MSLAIDSSGPARFTAVIASNGTIVSASFTAPANSLLVVTVCWDGQSDSDGGISSLSDSGSLTWTKQVERTCTEATSPGAGSALHTARTTTAASRTVTVTRSNSGGSNYRWSARCYVVTGADVNGTPVDSVTASNEGSDSANNLTTTSITAGMNGLLFAVGTDYNALGAPTSSDLTADPQNYAGAISMIDGYKFVAGGASVNANLDASGSSAAIWKWCQAIVRQYESRIDKVISRQAVNRASTY